ncbi:kelch-like protein 40 [Oculina patagonica]
MGAITSRKKYTLTSSDERRVRAEAMGASDEMNVTLKRWQKLTTSGKQDTLTSSDKINVSAEAMGATTSREQDILTSSNEINVSTEAMGATTSREQDILTSSNEINVSTEAMGATTSRKQDTLTSSNEINVSAEAMGATSSMKQDIFMPQETHDNPFDITLVVEDGTEFKAHRKVLSEASSFFEKLLNTDMMESKKGVVRLEMLTEAGLGAVLEFIYTGDVQILTEDDARGLIEMADYLFILPLKFLARRVLAQMLNTSNCISVYYFAERYQCEELTSGAKKFIHANFTNVAKAEEFLNMPSEEVNQWISSDEINVSAEEDVFNIILAWIDHNKSERKKYFADLFRYVRLIYVSRDFLYNDIATNDLVNDNPCCLELVIVAMKAIDSSNSENVSFLPPRKSLETPAFVVRKRETYTGHNLLMCYVPSTNTWFKLSASSPLVNQMVSCHGMLYTFYSRRKRDYELSRFDSFFDQWTDVPYKGNRDLRQFFSSDNNEDGIYVLESESEMSCPDCVSLHSCSGPERVSEFFPCGKQHLSYIRRYKPESNSWNDVAAFDFGLRREICIVAKDNFIYFIGGEDENSEFAFADVDRYDINERKWEKLADLQESRGGASGTAVHGKIFIAGGWCCYLFFTSCEVYNETTNEWQFIAHSTRSPYFDIVVGLMSVDEKVYVVDSWFNREWVEEIKCYDSEKDKWEVVTQLPTPKYLNETRLSDGECCSMRVFIRGNLQWRQVIP